MANLTIIILSSIILILVIFNIVQFNRNAKLVDKNNQLGSKVKEVESDFKVQVGSRGVIPNFPLVNNNTNHEYKVDYVIEILEVGETMLKVKSNEFTSNDAYARDPKNKQMILDVLNVSNPWVKMDEVELLYDDTMRRNNKLEQLLDK